MTWYQFEAVRVITDHFYVEAETQEEAYRKANIAIEHVEWNECWREHEVNLTSYSTTPKPADQVWTDHGFIIGNELPEVPNE